VIPLKLTMEGFGPFRSATLDFSALGQQQLFLISGPTGAGKSTIFDGITYALYGKPSGSHKSEYELKSDFVPEDQEARVALDFRMNGRDYHVERSFVVSVDEAQQKRLKTTGTRFYPLGQEEKTLSKAREVDAEITRLLGLDFSQFRQTILIPQGEYRELLTASSQAREEAFQEIFGTAFYKSFELALKDRQKGLYGELEDARKDRDSRLEILSQVADDSLQEMLSRPQRNYRELGQHIVELQEQYRNRRQKVQEQLKRLGETLDSLKREKAEADRARELKNQLQKFQDSLQTLEKQGPAMESMEKDLTILGRLEILKPRWDQVREMEESLEGQKRELQEKERDLQELTERLEKAQQEETKRPAREKLLEEMKETLGRYRQLSGVFGEIRDKRSALNEVLTHINMKEGEAASLEADILKAEGESRVLGQQLEAAPDLLVRKEKLSSQMRELERKKSVMESLLQVSGQQAELEGKVKSLEEQYLQEHSLLVNRNEELASLRDMRVRLSASILAEELQDGVACPVCGSLEHPDPAVSGGTLTVSDRMIREMEEETKKHTDALRNTEKALQSLKETASSLLASRRELSRQLDPYEQEVICIKEKDLTDLQGRIAASAQEHMALEAQIELNQESLKQQKALQEVLLSYSGRLKATQEHLQEMKMDKTRLETTLQELESRIPEDLREETGFLSALEELERKTVALAASLDGQRKEMNRLLQEKGVLEEGIRIRTFQYNDTVRKLAESRRRFEASLDEEKFTLSSWQEASLRLGGADAAVMKETIRNYRKDLEGLQAAIRHTGEDLENISAREPEFLSGEISGLSGEREILSGQQSSLDSDLRLLGSADRMLQETQERMSVLEASYQEVRELYTLASGDNRERLPLNSYVLRIHLQRVLQAANARLTRMTGGRYQLQMAGTFSTRARNAGLDFGIFDFYTGRERSVKSLSGGESFQTALAFALGVSDVIRHTAGGIHLNTLFIDEGFGTLDAESLDMAIEMLIELQSDGRLVGIISHVPELKERIGAQVRIVPDVRGSTIEVYS